VINVSRECPVKYTRRPAASNFGVNSRRFFDVPRVLIVNARSFQALAAILDYVTHFILDVMLVSIRSQADLLRISKVRGYEHVCSRWSANKTRKYQL